MTWAGALLIGDRRGIVGIEIEQIERDDVGDPVDAAEPNTR